MESTRWMLMAAALGMASSAAGPAAAQARAQVEQAPPLERESPSVYTTDQDWFRVMWPGAMKPRLDDRKLALTLVSFLPLGAVWGPMVLLGQEFNLDWALPPLTYQVVGALPVFFFWVPVIGLPLAMGSYLAGSWLGAMTMLGNLNRPDVELTVAQPE